MQLRGFHPSRLTNRADGLPQRNHIPLFHRNVAKVRISSDDAPSMLYQYKPAKAFDIRPNKGNTPSRSCSNCNPLFCRDIDAIIMDAAL